MPDYQTFIKFLYASIIINLIPGADRVFVVATALTHKLKSGLLATLGISTAIFIHSLIGAFGLAALIQSYPSVFNLIRLSGILLLLFLGIQFLIRPSVEVIAKHKVDSNGLYWKGVLIHLLNPIALVFSFTFIPQFIAPGNDFATQFLLLSLTSNGLSFTINMVVVLFIISIQKQLQLPNRISRILSGLILIGLSLKLSWDWIIKIIWQ